MGGVECEGETEVANLFSWTSYIKEVKITINYTNPYRWNYIYIYVTKDEVEDRKLTRPKITKNWTLDKCFKFKLSYIQYTTDSSC